MECGIAIECGDSLKGGEPDHVEPKMRKIYTRRAAADALGRYCGLTSIQRGLMTTLSTYRVMHSFHYRLTH